MARKIVITSGKGGVGKTTVCANLGIALAKMSKRVMLLDLDIGLNNLDVALGIESKVVYDFVDVVEGKCRPMQALVQDETEPTLYTMPTCHLAKRQISVDATKKVISRLSDMFDYILIDCPAGIDGGFRRASACADEAIVVTTPHLPCVRDAQKTIAQLADKIATYVVINRMRGDLVLSGEMLSAFEIFSLLGKTPLGILPENDEVNCNLWLYAKRPPFDMLAKNLATGSADMYDCEQTYRGFWGKIRRKLRRNIQ